MEDADQHPVWRLQPSQPFCSTSYQARGNRSNHPFHGERSCKLNDRKRGPRRRWLHGPVKAPTTAAAAIPCGLPQHAAAGHGSSRCYRRLSR
jgi:hypothetical protein